ncbi:uncharacterized protein LOC121924050 isoform X1 [Sceloporus undulatus]|uniref:uncharacterized protein LOC121924050 isoform X1 n=1 Tax=Sceloporus undulatus TaxID=8520 RepID=UPI001C4C65DC|nr:uncharacterized protein LOC121924050 isoform X1 [Sceloporus undulatus]
MLPLKGRCASNLVLCKTTVKMDPKPPDPSPQDPPNPSLLKALEAVVAAGRRGLLGPDSIPEGGGTSSNGAASQAAALSPIPLLSSSSSSSDGKKRIKDPGEKREAVITVVQPAEDIGSLQPAPKEVWIFGNSVILTAKERAQSNPHGLQLGIPDSKAYVYWHGMQAMKWEQLLPALHETYRLRSPPSVIIIHLGEDDLLPEDNISLIMSMKNDLGILRRAFPDAVIVWSSLLPTSSKEDHKPELMGKAQKQVNIKMVAYCNINHVYFMSHNLITSDKAGLFLPDGNGLSDAGADRFIADVQRVLRLYHILG